MLKNNAKIIITGFSIIAALFSTALPASAEQSSKFDKKTAYLIIDIQNDYLPDGKFELLNSEKAAENAKSVLTYFRKNKGTIIHIRHENTGSTAAFFIPGTDGAKFYEPVTPLKNETVLLKHKPSSFIGTTLEDELKKNGITHLIISGMQSNICVKSTALEALTKGYSVTVLEDSIAARNEELHNNAVKEMKETGAAIAMSKDVTGK